MVMKDGDVHRGFHHQSLSLFPITRCDTKMMKKSILRLASGLSSLLIAAAIVLGPVGCASTQTGSDEGQRGLPLEKTVWRLIGVESASLSAGPVGREPYIQFDPEKKRVTGYSGVNSFLGGYSSGDGALRFSPLASTRRAGPPELMELESVFLKALAETRSYRITRDRLELLDSGGRTVARFEAQKMP